MDPNTPAGQDTTTPPPSGETQPDDAAGEANKRSAESRIDQLIAQNKELLAEKLSRDEQRVAPIPPVSQEMTPEVKRAIETIKNFGFPTNEELEAKLKSVRNSIEDQMVLNTENQRLSEVYDGKDGRPKFNAPEIEEYGRKHGIFNPEAAYEQMHKTELLDWHLKTVNQGATTNQPYTTPIGPSSTRGEDNIITREKIAEKLKEPGGMQWYEENRQKILDLAHAGAL